MFSDTEIDIWLQNGGVGNIPVSDRRHSLSDSFAIVGVRSPPRGLRNWSTTSAQMRTDDGSTVVDVKEGQITVTAPNVVVTAQTVSVQGNSTVGIDGASAVNIASATQVNISGGGNTIIDGVNFLDHIHDNVAPGSGVSGPVVVP